MKRTAIVRSRRETPVLVCKKCLKRSPEGAKIRQELKRELKRGAGGAKRSRLVSTGCFKICPKGAVVLASGQSLARGEYVLVPRHQDADVAFGLLMSTD